MDCEHVDVLIVGAGLSGVGAACHLRAKCPGKSFAILEERHTLGGTWDLFRFPGIRSDSDMYTLGFSFRPWSSNRTIADGPSILRYLQATAEEHGIDRCIRFDHRVTRASWSSTDALWTVEAEVGPERRPVRYTCAFLFGPPPFLVWRGEFRISGCRAHSDRPHAGASLGRGSVAQGRVQALPIVQLNDRTPTVLRSRRVGR